MGLKAQHRNALPSTAVGNAGSATSAIISELTARGCRVYINVTAGVGIGNNDAVYLCAVSPAGVVVPAASAAAISIISGATGSTVVVDFYPGPVAASAANGVGGYMVTSMCLPLRFAIKVQLGAGQSATFSIDVETLP